MAFRFYSNSFNQISEGFSKGLFIVGLLLIGFGTLVWILKEVLAVIAAAIFIIAGAGCCINAVRLYITTRKTRPFNDQTAGRSDNVKIRIENNTNED